MSARGAGLRIGWVACIAVAVLAWPIAGWSRDRLVPVDEAASVPAFFAFRARLQAAVARRDTAAVMAVLDKDVVLTFGGDSGPEGFRRVWTPDAVDSALWETLATVLALGGTFDADGSFTAPYVFTQWPADKDVFDHVAVIGTGVRVRERPHAEGAILDTLDFAILETASAEAAEGWTAVKLAEDRIGYVDRRFVRSPIDHRIRFVRHGGGWRATFFVAGD